MRYITDLTVLEGKDAQPRSGWTKIDKDLNAGAGGEYLYFAYEEGDNRDQALTDIKFIVGKDQPTPYKYTKIDVDLNQGAGGKYIYAVYTREPISPDNGMADSPIVALDVSVTDGPEPDVPRQWDWLSQDLNEGVKGKYVYLIYKTADADKPERLMPI
jgi:hypothetical protein